MSRPACPATVAAEKPGMSPNAMAAGFVMLAGLATLTGIVAIDSLVAAMKQLVPSYRRQHIETNDRALRLAAEAATSASAALATA